VSASYEFYLRDLASSSVASLMVWIIHDNLDAPHRDTKSQGCEHTMMDDLFADAWGEEVRYEPYRVV
jgi:hypothetical protein